MPLSRLLGPEGGGGGRTNPRRRAAVEIGGDGDRVAPGEAPRRERIHEQMRGGRGGACALRLAEAHQAP